ncbi:MAG TPA: dephospho-CoA kinase [Lichenihabitans sp.]|jgi:dephospho-CoA kinase|nr:dephospho-CoA kinase [Lichenihabitans sp.]
MKVLGLTGSIGMGKSATSAMFAEAGVPVFDADARVHALYRGAAVEPVGRAFPEVVVGGVVDRSRLSAQVLADPAALRRLETIVHPLVREARETFLGEARASGAALALLDIPLLYETGGEADVDAVVVVSAPESVQKARVLARPGMTEAKFSAIVAKQVPDAEKRRRARFVIDTAHGFAAARRQVGAVIAAMKQDEIAEP